MKQNANILVIDDEEIIRKSCLRILEPLGFKVDTAPDGPSALSMLGNRRNYDLVLTDLKMPNMDGLEVMAEILKRFPGLRIILVTGYSTRETAASALKMGAFNYVEKPFNPEVLGTVVREALEGID